jgi:hypothetical protein
MKSLHRHLVAAGLVATIGLGAFAQAQPQQPGAGGPQMMQGQRGQQDPARAERFRARQQERMAKRLGVLKAQLKIAPAQEGAWTAWTTALQPAARAPRPDRAEMARLTTPERIDRMKARRAARQADMDRRLDATKAFYTALNPEQRAAFDAVGLRFMGGKGKRGGHGHGGRGDGGMRHHQRG